MRVWKGDRNVQGGCMAAAKIRSCGVARLECNSIPVAAGSAASSQPQGSRKAGKEPSRSRRRFP